MSPIAAYTVTAVITPNPASWVMLRTVPNANSRWRYLNLFPVFGALFDYLENIATSVVMLNYPIHTPVVDLLAPIFTLIKWFFVNGSFVILVPALLVAVWKWVHGRAAPTQPPPNATV